MVFSHYSLLKPWASRILRLAAPKQSGILRLFLLLQLALLTSRVNAQDLIVQLDKSRIEAKVLEVTDEAIRYKKFDFLDGPTYSIRKTNVFMIIYKSGRTETFDAQPPKRETLAARPASPAPARPNKGLAAPPAPAAPGPPAGSPAPAREYGADALTANPSGIVKNPFRIIISPGLYTNTSGYGNPALKAGVEFIDRDKKLGFLSRFNNVGVGAAASGLFGMSWDAANNERIVWNKYYLSGYAFKEFDTRIISAGILLGPGFNYTRAIYYFDGNNASRGYDISTGYLTVGLHAGEYLQKYILWANKKGEKSIFLRFGFDQYLMAQGPMGSSFFLSLGF